MTDTKHISIDRFKELLEQKDLTPYKLIKLTGIKKPTLYTYMNGTTPLNESLCSILADAINVDILEAFPDLRKNDEKVPEPTEHPNHHPTITIQDMVADAATLVPEDGFTVKSRKVIDHFGMEHDALAVQIETQVVIATGVKVKNLDLERIIIRGMTQYILENECHVPCTPISRNGELCIAMYVHGKPLKLCRGKEVAQVLYI